MTITFSPDRPMFDTSEPVSDTSKRHPSPRRVCDMILHAAEVQYKASAAAAAIIAAGLEEALRALVRQIAANAANPIVDAFEPDM
jgi:hypothetical protein